MTVFLFLFFSLAAFAQEFQYRIEGSFITNATPGTSETNATVNYNVSWNETSTAIQGLYKDNYFSQAGLNVVSGSVEVTGRTMNVILPQPVNSVRMITLTTNQLGNSSGTIPVSITTKNNIGSAIDNVSGSFALMSTLQAQTASEDEDNNSCVVGFGSLTGFCGIYNGAFNEVNDNRNRCDILAAGNPRLELGADTVFRIYLNYISGNTAQSSHTVGTFLPSPMNRSINIRNRYCTELPGTTFVEGNCKTLALTGDFSDTAGTFSFNGTYSITDDTNGDVCEYNLILIREQEG